MQAVRLQDAQVECQFVKKKNQTESAEFDVEQNTIEMENIAHIALILKQEKHLAKNVMGKGIVANVSLVITIQVISSAIHAMKHRMEKMD